MRKRKILILSSNKEMYHRVRHRLRQKPYYEVYYTNSYDEAYRKVREGDVDFLFYEVNKALEDGVRKLDKMKEANSKVPVVISAVLNIPFMGRREKLE